MAGITYLEEFSQESLRGLVDETVANAQSTLADRFLPNINVYSTKFAYDIIKTNAYIGAYIGYGAEPPVIDRDAVASMAGELGKMGIKSIVTEEELLALNQARSNSEKSAIIDKLLIDGIKLVEAIQRRIYVTKMETITKGEFVYKKNGVDVRVDFGVPADHKVALTAGNDWDVADHDVITDLMTWVEKYVETNGKVPDAILMSRKAFTKLMKNNAIIAEARGSETLVRRVSEAEVQSVLQGYGLPAITIVDDRTVTIKDMYTDAIQTIEVLPENRVVFVSDGLGEYLLGPTVENEFEPGIFLGAYDERNPIRSVFESVAAGFPALKTPDLLFHADVYTVA